MVGLCLVEHRRFRFRCVSRFWKLFTWLKFLFVHPSDWGHLLALDWWQQTFVGTGFFSLLQRPFHGLFLEFVSLTFTGQLTMFIEFYQILNKPFLQALRPVCCWQGLFLLWEDLSFTGWNMTSELGETEGPLKLQWQEQEAQRQNALESGARGEGKWLNAHVLQRCRRPEPGRSSWCQVSSFLSTSTSTYPTQICWKVAFKMPLTLISLTPPSEMKSQTLERGLI